MWGLERAIIIITGKFMISVAKCCMKIAMKPELITDVCLPWKQDEDQALLVGKPRGFKKCIALPF